MMKFLCLALLVAGASAASTGITGGATSIKQTRGPVPFTLCPGEQQGEALALRISNCDGPGCVIVPGTVVSVEGDFRPAINCADAQFVAVAIVAGIPIPVADGRLGALNAGTPYTVTQEISVSDALSGLNPIIRIRVTEGPTTIICVETPVSIA